jgi:hypothetical protein
VFRELLARLVAWLKQKRQQRRDALMFERHVIVEHDEIGVRVAHPDGDPQAMNWSDLRVVAIETNDSGPWGADLWWLLEGEDRRIAYPQGATGESAMLGVLQSRLAGFQDEAVILAMGCTENARFVCWTRSEGVTHPTADDQP